MFVSSSLDVSSAFGKRWPWPREELISKNKQNICFFFFTRTHSQKISHSLYESSSAVSYLLLFEWWTVGLWLNKVFVWLIKKGGRKSHRIVFSYFQHSKMINYSILLYANCLTWMQNVWHSAEHCKAYLLLFIVILK